MKKKKKGVLTKSNVNPISAEVSAGATQKKKKMRFSRRKGKSKIHREATVKSTEKGKTTRKRASSFL